MTVDVPADSTINLIGTDFLLDGLAIESLAVGTTVTIDANYSLLTGTLANGADFDFVTLFPNRFFPDTSFSANVTLTVTLVPEPCGLAMIGLFAGGLLARRNR